METTYIDHIYLAGLIDADGCLGINKVDKGRYAPCLSFVNTSIDLVLLFKKHFGGSVRIKQHKHPAKPTYEIQLRNTAKLIPALGQLIPFLRLKQDKARLVKDYAISIQQNKNRKITDVVLKDRERIMNQWKLL